MTPDTKALVSFIRSVVINAHELSGIDLNSTQIAEKTIRATSEWMAISGKIGTETSGVDWSKLFD